MDRETSQRMLAGVKPDLIGCAKIALEAEYAERTIRRWYAKRAQNGIPIISWGPGKMAAYADRLRAWLASRQPSRSLAA
jgi:hypothetical protein